MMGHAREGPGGRVPTRQVVAESGAAISLQRSILTTTDPTNKHTHKKKNDKISQEVDTTFESADAGASTTYPMQAGSIRKGGHICIKGRPCKVVDVTTSKTGKHGHAKCHFVAIDIFTGKKMEELCSSSHNMDVPNVTRTEYTLIDVNDEGFVSLMSEDGDTREDLSLPKHDDSLAKQIKDDFDAGKELLVTIMGAMNEEHVHAVKEASN